MSAPAPKVGKVTDEEIAALAKWDAEYRQDKVLSRSLARFGDEERRMIYPFVRALRAGVPLEKLL